MILRYDFPKLSLYNIGAIILDILANTPSAIVDSLELFKKAKNDIGDDISLSSFLLAIDWLFLLGLVESDKNGDITKCF